MSANGVNLKSRVITVSLSRPFGAYLGKKPYEDLNLGECRKPWVGSGN